jgi:CO/xanthine dehydrogenase Mo-binding subunit
VLELASELLGAPQEKLDLMNGSVCVIDDPQCAISLGDLAQQANPLRGAVRPGTEPGLEATNYFGPERGATASGVHAMIVEVDPGTLEIDIKKYVVVHDCGKIINPMIVDGQIHGGVAQGIGNAFYEELCFDDLGRISNATFREYLLPTALEIPKIELDHRETPSPLNPMGIKGVGEAGAIPVGPLFAQALEDALAESGIEIREIPLSPSKLWGLVEGVRGEG